jgi:hypothetical protein
MKNPLTLVGIEPATFRFVALCYSGPYIYIYIYIYSLIYIYTSHTKMKTKNLILSSRASAQWLDKTFRLFSWPFHIFYMHTDFLKCCIITTKCTINTITVYITKVSLCNLYSYIFRHFHIVIRQFTANALLSYIVFSIAAVASTIYKITMLKTTYVT